MKALTLKTKSSISTLQYPQLRKDDLILYFYKEIKNQHHSTLTRSSNKINFTIKPFDFTLNRYKNKFGNYSEGYFEILEEDHLLTVIFKGNLNRGLYHAGFIPIFLFIVSLGFISQDFYYFPIIPLLFWPLFFAISYIMEIITKPLYLTFTINRIREKLRDGELITKK